MGNIKLRDSRLISSIIGAFIGCFPVIEFIIGIFPNSFIYKTVRSINDIVLYFPRNIVHNIYDCLLCEGALKITIIIMIISVCFYAILGFGVGSIIYGIKNTKGK